MDPLSIPPAMLNDMMSRLTPRQLEIVALLAEGRTNRDIGTILSISVETVKSHVHKSFRKTNLENRMQLGIAFAMWKLREPVTNP